MVELVKDLFIIPIDGRWLVYSPLRGGLFQADHYSVEIVRQYLKGVPMDTLPDKAPVKEYLKRLEEMCVEEPSHSGLAPSTHVIIILSQICNMACSYCYAQEARSKEILSQEKLQIVLDEVLHLSNPRKSITFIGGGEPLVTWDRIKWCLEYVAAHKVETDRIKFSITTNLTLLNDEILSYLKQYNVHLGVSFEILKEVQDEQRPFYRMNESTFDRVHKNIGLLMSNHIPFDIRSTITDRNVSLMPEMAEFACRSYPVLKKLHFEQVTDPKTNRKEYYDRFIAYFLKAREIGKRYGVEVYNSISRSVFRITERFCGGEFCVTPSGSIVACHRVSSEKEENYDLFHIGDVDKEVVYDSERVSRFLEFANKKQPECESCFAFWHCAGICSMERSVLSEQQIEDKCEFTKLLVVDILEEIANQRPS